VKRRQFSTGFVDQRNFLLQRFRGDADLSSASFQYQLNARARLGAVFAS
jgi:hypothetical protein